MTAKKATQKYSYREELLITQLEILQHGLDLITQEIYENTGQLLSLVKLNLGKLLSAREGDRELMLLQSKKMVSQVILDLRKISKPVGIKELYQNGLQAALRHELELRHRLNKSSVHFAAGETFFRFDKDRELVVFRIIQELLAIMEAHFSDRPMELATQFNPSQVSIRIKDSPGRAVITECPEIASLGPVIKKLRKRARMIKAGLSINCHRPNGLEIILQLPLNPKSIQP